MKLKNLLNEIQIETGKVYSNPYATAFKSIQEDETQDSAEVMVGEYQTKYFDICPGATAVYKDIESKGVDMDMAERSAKLQDALFFIEKHVLNDDETGSAEGYITVAENLADQIMAMAEMMGLEKEHSYIQGHVDKIKQAVSSDVSEQTNKLHEGEFTMLYKGSRTDAFILHSIKEKNKESALKWFVNWYKIPKNEWDDIKIWKEPNIFQKLIKRF